jgi:hypothetical protein
MTSTFALRYPPGSSPPLQGLTGTWIARETHLAQESTGTFAHRYFQAEPYGDGVYGEVPYGSESMSPSQASTGTWVPRYSTSPSYGDGAYGSGAYGR